jgi:hypothetical protein
MSSDKQIAANRLNAQESTGPRSLAGKAKVSRNALKHGLTATHVVLPDENPDEFESFRADLLTRLDPHDELENVFAQKIATDAWRLRRVPRLEALFYRHGCAESLVRQTKEAVLKHKLGSADILPLGDPQAHDLEQRLTQAKSQLDDPALNVALALKTSPEPFRNLTRHEAALTRSLLRGMHELERLQAKRAGQHVPVPAIVDVDVSVPQPDGANVEGANISEENDKN